MKLGKNQAIMLVSFGLATTSFYYAKKYIEIGRNFSDGILVGFLLGLTFVCSLSCLFLFGRMIYQNFKVRIKKDDY